MFAGVSPFRGMISSGISTNPVESVNGRKAASSSLMPRSYPCSILMSALKLNMSFRMDMDTPDVPRSTDLMSMIRRFQESSSWSLSTISIMSRAMLSTVFRLSPYASRMPDPSSFSDMRRSEVMRSSPHRTRSKKSGSILTAPSGAMKKSMDRPDEFLASFSSRETFMASPSKSALNTLATRGCTRMLRPL